MQGGGFADGVQLPRRGDRKDLVILNGVIETCGDIYLFFWFTYAYTHTHTITIGALMIRIRVWVMLYYNLTRPGGNTVANCSDPYIGPTEFTYLVWFLWLRLWLRQSLASGLGWGGGGRGVRLRFQLVGSGGIGGIGIRGLRLSRNLTLSNVLQMLEASSII